MARKNVTSDPDRGVAANSGTDPQRPGAPARPPSDTSDAGAPAGAGTGPPDRFEATRTPDARPGEDVEGAGAKGDPDDAL